MFSIAKCSDHSAGAEPEAGGGLIKTSLPSDEVASAVAAVSDEIGDILKDELGDADRADRIGAELADLSAELGLLAGLADEPQQNFPSLFEIDIGHRGSGSGSSSSSWSGGRGGRRRPPRPQRAPRRRPIAKGKEMSRRRSAAARRAASTRVRRVEVVSDASDVGADSDSDDQWTELDDNSGTTDSSSGEDAGVADVDCPGFQDKGSQVEAPAMGQFLLPLLSTDPTGPEPEHFLIRHEDILQLLASAESSVREGLPLMHDDELDSTDGLNSEVLEYEEPLVTPEDEAALLHYVCEAEIDSYDGQMEEFRPVQEWLLGVYHSWCEISALMYTLVGSGVNVNEESSEWSYRARFGCHCRLCLGLANNERALRRLLRALVCSLARGGNSTLAAHVVRALQLKPGQSAPPSTWDLQRLRRLKVPDEGAAIIHEHLSRLALHGEVTGEILTKICLCRQHERPFEKQYAMERFCKLLENFKTASTINFKVELVAGEGSEQWAEAALTRLARCLAPHQRRPTAERLAHMAARTAPHDLSAWSGYKHRCDCLTPRTLCAQQRKQLLRISLFGMMQAMNEFNYVRGGSDEKPPIDVSPEGDQRQLQHGDGTGAKPPEQCLEEREKENSTPDLSDSNITGDFDDITDSDGNSGGSLGLSTSSSLDSASELLLAAAAAVESGGSEGEAAPGELCRTVRHLMRSIASIERLMDRVLKHCDEWPIPPSRNDHEARKRVDHGLSEVDRKLMAMYQRLPEVHRRQLQVYRKQKKLSTVCAQLVGGSAPAPPAPASPPPAPAHAPCTALCPEYHLQRFKEVRRKVMHMRDQQLYYHRLRMWLEDQLRQERDSVPDSNVTLVGELPRRKRRTLSPKAPKTIAAPKRKLKTSHVSQYMSKPHKLLQLLKHKAPPVSEAVPSPYKEIDDEANVRSEAEPPEAFPLEKEDNVSDTETIVGEKENDICKDMKDCLVKFANFALNSPDNVQTETAVKYPESVSPPLQELSPTTPEPAANTPDIVIPFNTRAPVTLNKEGNRAKEVEDNENPDAFKYMTFGLEIKKAMEECQNIINSYNSVGKDEKVLDNEPDGNYSLEQIVEVIMSLDKNTTELLDKMDTDETVELNSSNTKLAELVENMPQILANMPEIASKLSEFANASFELPEFASIMNSLPDVNNEAQLTPETLKQIRDLKLSKRDSVKVTKNTAKRKINRKYKNSDNDVVSTVAFEFESKDITELLKEDAELQALIKSKTNKEDVKDLLFSMSAQAVVNKVFEHVKNCKTPELAKYLDEDKEIFIPSNNMRGVMLGNSSTLFDDSVKDVCSMDELREFVKSRFNSWKHYVATKFKSIPVEFLDSEIEIMLDKIYAYIQDLASKENGESDKIIEKIDELRKNKETSGSESDGCVAGKESLKQLSKFLSTSAGNTFDLLIMRLSKMSQDNKSSVNSLKFKYIDMIRRCTESQELICWILLDPDIATNVIQELTGLEVREIDNLLDFSTMTGERKKEYFLIKFREMNKQFMNTLPKEALTGDEWLVMLYKLEQLEGKLKEAFAKVMPPPKVVQAHGASEAEILAAKGLSKIIGKANVRIVKKTDPAKPAKKEVDAENEPNTERDDKKMKNDALLAKCEAILTSKGEKSLLDSFYTIKSYITQGLPVPETYKKHVISICSCIDARLLDEDAEQTLKLKNDEEYADLDNGGKDKNPLSVIGSQNPELLAKYSAQALRNAKQTLNAVAFRNLMRNGQSKSESDTCDTPRSTCKWTNDCVCETCREDVAGVSISDIIKQCYEEEKTKNGLEEKKREAKKPIQKSKSTPKMCENAMHPQHVCKAGHGGGCAGDGGDQPCTCCYCTVFGHAPPLTTPVPRNFNETRERLRSILNKKKLKCKSNGEVSAEQGGKPPPAAAAAAPHATPKPPALPKTLPPTLTTAEHQQQRQLAEKMAKMAVSETPEPKPQQQQVQQKSSPVPALRTDGRVNANAMEQIRLQQLKQQQLQQMQQQLQQLQHQQDQQTQQQKQQSAPQKKPEPIYDLPIHNKPQLTPQQQQQIRQQQQQQQQQQQLLRQQQLQQQQIQQQHMQQQQQLQQQQMQQQQAQQRQARQQQRPAVSLSSRDTSVFSTSSGCSGGSCWRGAGRAEDPRDLDALLQYIEGPARHVDRGKKKAKKQRQRAKKTEARLSEMAERLRAELAEGRRTAGELRNARAAAERQVRGARQALAQHRPRRKGKKHKVNPEHQSNMELLGEILADYTVLVTSTAKELENVEKYVSDCSKQLQQVERELCEARSTMDGQNECDTLVHHQTHNVTEVRPTARADAAPEVGGVVRVRRTGPAGVTLSLAGRPDAALDGLLRASDHLTVLNVRDTNQTTKQVEKKQTWEQAIAHMNQLAKGAQKEKKKIKEPPKQEEKVKTAVVETVSKKQRKLLAKQQAEEEKRKQELEKKKQEKKIEPVKENSKKDKKEQKKEMEAKKTKEDKKENKKQEEKLGKENKQVKNVQTATKSKASKKGTAAHACGPDAEKPASCSIMEQLSCGVQVADLRLPPGITLTRVQPYEKKEPAIKSVPLWKCGQLPAAPTPPVRPPPVINADPNMLVFSTPQPEPPKTVLVPEPQPQPTAKSKKAKKKAKKAAAAESAEQKQDGAKMVTLRNPMFHPNLPPVQIADNQSQKKSEIRIPDPIPMPPTPCQATITPTSNGMYTIRNPLMSMMHQHSLMGMRNPAPQGNPMFTPPQYNYVNPNTYTPQPQYVLDPARSSPKAPENDFQNRIMNLASFTQKNDEGYSLFKTSDNNQQKSFLVPEYFESHSPKVVSPNPIGTRPEQNRNYEDSLFVKPIQRPEPIGTPLKREEERPEYAGLYTPFGQIERSNVFRTALFDKSESKGDEGQMNGDQLPYFQRLRAGSKLNSEVTIHYVTDSKYYKGQEVQQEMQDESLFSRPQPAWTHPNCEFDLTPLKHN